MLDCPRCSNKPFCLSPSICEVEERPEKWETPLQGWKLAYLDFNTGMFHGVVRQQLSYQAVDVAICDNSRHYDAKNDPFQDRIPALTCVCGFYALRKREQIKKHLMDCHPVQHFYNGSILRLVVLEVELYGKVLVAELGYRAEKQRVMAVYGFKPKYKCNYGGGWVTPCYDKARYFHADTGRYLCPIHKCVNSYPITHEKPNISVEFHWLEEQPWFMNSLKGTE